MGQRTCLAFAPLDEHGPSHGKARICLRPPGITSTSGSTITTIVGQVMFTERHRARQPQSDFCPILSFWKKKNRGLWAGMTYPGSHKLSQGGGARSPDHCFRFLSQGSYGMVS